jgi:serine/threonine protein kinase
MKNCLLCNDEFEGSDPICPKCTSEHLAASVYRDDDEAGSEIPAQQARPGGAIGLSPSLESVSMRGRVTPGAPPKRAVSGPQGSVKRSGPTMTPRPGASRTPAFGKMQAPVALSTENQIAPGTVLLGQFRVDKKLGEGGFGAVFLAEQIGLERKAVIKVVHPQLASNPTFVARFHREAKVLAALDHHHLVKIFNFGQLPSGLLFLVMEFGGDKTLAQELTACGGKLDLKRSLQITSQVLDALVEAHSHGIVHRDLKPANILLGKKGGEEWVKIVDVGIAKVMHAEEEKEDERLTGTGMVVGTPSYYSPEQACGLDVDGRSDLYAAGIVLYEMLTGHLPIKGKTPIDFVRAHAVDQPTPAEAYGIHLPEKVDKIITRSLQKDPAKRFPTAQAMKGAIDEARAQISMVGGVPAMTTRGRRVRRKQLFAAGAALALVAALAAVMLGTSGPDKPKKPTVAARPPAEVPLSPRLAAATPVPPVETPRPPAEIKPPEALPAVAAAETQKPSEPAEAAPAPAERPVHLLVRVPGSEVKILDAESSDGNVTLPAASGHFRVENPADGWTVNAKYRRSGSSLALTLEAKPAAVLYVDDEPIGKVGVIKVSRSAISKVVFKPAEGNEFTLMAKYTP